jgi:hypothetical protein
MIPIEESYLSPMLGTMVFSNFLISRAKIAFVRTKSAMTQEALVACFRQVVSPVATTISP